MSFNFFSTNQYLGLIRHLLTAAGGALVAKGVISSQVLNEVVGALMTLIGLSWSLVFHAPAEETIDQAKNSPDPLDTNKK
jgi:hypothetical protein